MTEPHALAGAYALDALDHDERTEFEHHLAGCADCADEVRSLQNAAVELSHMSAVAPPPQLRADLLADIARVRPLAPVTDNVIALRRARTGRSVWQVMAAACALIAVIAAGWGYQQSRDAARHSTALVSVADQVLRAPDARAVSGDIGAGHATVIYSKSEQKVALIAHQLPALTKSQTYQLWLIADQNGGEKFTSAGTFSPDGAGNVTATVTGDVSATAKMGVTIEPAGGSAQPTSAPIAEMSI